MSTRKASGWVLPWIALIALSYAPAALDGQQQQGSDDAAGATENRVRLEVEQVIGRFHEALRSGDEAAVRQLMTSDVRILEGGGIETLEEYVSHHLAADMAFAAAVDRQRGPLEVFHSGEVAWATSTSRSTGMYRGRDIDSSGAELIVLRRLDGAWRIEAVHWSSR